LEPTEEEKDLAIVITRDLKVTGTVYTLSRKCSVSGGNGQEAF